MAASLKTWINNRLPTCAAEDLNGFLAENNNAIEAGGIVLDTATTHLQTSQTMTNHASGADFYADLTGSTPSVYTVTHSSGTPGTDPGFENVTSTGASPAGPGYFVGMRVRFIPTATNNASATVNVSGLGSKSIFNGGSAIGAGDFPENLEVTLVYNGIQFDLVGTGKGPKVINNHTAVNGVGEDSLNMGNFSGTVLINGQTTKASLQTLGTSLDTANTNISDNEDDIGTNETNITNNRAIIDAHTAVNGVAALAQNMGNFTEDSLSNGQTIKECFQELAGEVDDLNDEVVPRKSFPLRVSFDGFLDNNFDNQFSVVKDNVGRFTLTHPPGAMVVANLHDPSGLFNAIVNIKESTNTTKEYLLRNSGFDEVDAGMILVASLV